MREVMWHASMVADVSRAMTSEGGTRRTMTAKQSQHDAAESLFGAIIAILDKHTAAHTLTEQVVEELARAYAAVSTNVPEPGPLGQ